MAERSNMYPPREMLDDKLFDVGESEMKSFELETAKWPNVFLQHDAGRKYLMGKSFPVYPAKMFAAFELPSIFSFHILGQRWRNGRSYSSGKN